MNSTAPYTRGGTLPHTVPDTQGYTVGGTKGDTPTHTVPDTQGYTVGGTKGDTPTHTVPHTQGVTVGGTSQPMAPWLAELAARWAAPTSPEEEARMEAQRVARLEALAAAERAEREAQLLAQLPAQHLATPLERRLLPNLEATRAAFRWDGRFPGLLLTGPTGTGKTRTAIALLRKLCVEGRLRLKAYSLQALLGDLEEYNKHGRTRGYDGPNPYRTRADILFIDDIDKFNRQFQSQATMLWEFYNWVYADGRAALSTTQMSLEEWEKLMGASFARRLREAHHIIPF